MGPHSVLKFAGIYGIVDIISKIIGMMTMPLFTHYFSPEEYGQISLIATIVALMGVLGNPGISSAVHRYYHDLQTQEERKKYISTGVLTVISVTVILNILLGAIVFATAGWLSETVGLVGSVVVFAILANMPMAIIQYNQDILRLQFRAWNFVIVSCIRALLSAALAVVFSVLMDGGLYGYYLGFAVASFIAIPVSFWFLKLDINWIFDKGVARQLCHFGLPLLGSGLVSLVLVLSDRWMISAMIGADAAGLYGAGSQLGMVTAMFAVAIGQAWPPYVLKHWHDSKIFSVTAGKMLTHFYFAMSLLAVIAGFFCREIMMIFAPEPYWSAAMVIPILSMSSAIMATTQVTMIGLTYSKRSDLILLGTILAAAANVALNFFLIPVWGLEGAALATVFSYSLLTLFYVFWQRRFYPIKIETLRLIGITGFTALIIGVLWWIEIYLTWSIELFLAKAVACATVCAISIFFWRHHIVSLLRSFLSKQPENSP